ncbi:MAG: helix-turn-helix domain-containing protein [Deltaproteobacteria bacterium]|nr:helix-turn-helix domain-containing protein [Deltaproteobacteria bacterium]
MKRKYTLLSGEIVSLEDLEPREKEFLDTLAEIARRGISYFEIYRTAIGPGSIALRGRNHVNRSVLRSPLYLAARDIATRAGIDQGLILAPEHEEERARAPKDFSMMSVVQAADLIGISRAAVYKAIEKGRLRCHKIGNVTVVERASAIEYRDRRNADEPSRHVLSDVEKTGLGPLPAGRPARAVARSSASRSKAVSRRRHAKKSAAKSS